MNKSPFSFKLPNQYITQSKKIFSQSLMAFKQRKIKQFAVPFLSAIFPLDLDHSLLSMLLPQLQSFRQLLQEYLLSVNQQAENISNELMSNMYLCLASTCELTECQGVEQAYELALFYCQNNPKALFCYSLFFANKNNYKQARLYFNKIEVQNCIKQLYDSLLWNEFIMKIFLYWQNFVQRKQTITNTNQIEKRLFFSSLLEKCQLIIKLIIKIKPEFIISYITLLMISICSTRYNDCFGLLQIINQHLKINAEDQISQALFPSIKYLNILLNKEENIQHFYKEKEDFYGNQFFQITLVCKLMQQDNLDQLQKLGLMLINNNRHSCIGYLAFGLSFQLSNRYQEAYISYKLSLSIKQTALANYNLGCLILTKQKSLQKAQKYLIKSVLTDQAFRPLILQGIGLLYSSCECYLTGIQFLKESINLNINLFFPFFFLGLCGRKGILLKKIINSFMETLRLQDPQNIGLRMNIAIYYYISKQQSKQLFELLNKAVEQQRNQTQQKEYSNAVSYFVCLYIKIDSFFPYFDAVFLMIIGIFGRIKKQLPFSRGLYDTLMTKFKGDESYTKYRIFVQIYEKQIRLAQKSTQKYFLEFIMVEMVQQDYKQAIKCYQKAIALVQGEYKDFHSQMLCLIELQIEKVDQIDFIVSSIDNIDDEEMAKDIISKSPNMGLDKLMHFLTKMKNILTKLKELQTKQYPSARSWQIQLNIIIYNFLSNNQKMGISWQIIDLQRRYGPVYQQINKQQQNFQQIISRLCKIYKETESLQLTRALIFQLEAYYDNFVLNEKIKLIFNHFYSYIYDNEIAHWEFGQILYKLKNSPEYDAQCLKEDLRTIFQRNRIIEPLLKRDSSSSSSQASSFWQSTIDELLIELNSETKSQLDQNEKTDEFYIGDQQKNKIYRKKSESNIQLVTEQEHRQFIKEIQEKIYKQEAMRNIIPASFGKQKEDSISSSQCEELQQSQRSQFGIEASRLLDSSQSQFQKGWYQMQYFLSSTKFLKNTLYYKFNNLLYMNTYYIVQYLSEQENIKHVAKHLCPRTQIQASNSFRVNVELGDYIYYPYIEKNQEQKMLKWLWVAGSSHIFKWIINIALGVAELEDLGIFHADLFFRNTIKVTKGNSFSFKIIDFDKAFKVFQLSEKDESFECTKDIFDFWLRFSFKGNYSRGPAYRLDFSSESNENKESRRSFSYDVREIIEYIFIGKEQQTIQQLLEIKEQTIFVTQKMVKCLQMLKDYMKISHNQQYTLLVQRLLDIQGLIQSNQLFMQRERIESTLKQLTMLKQGEIDYIQFAKEVQAISGLKVAIEKDEEQL